MRRGTGYIVIFVVGAAYLSIRECVDGRKERSPEIEIAHEDVSQINAATATRDALTATELIELADCGSLQCVQLYMKDRSPDFVHASKGEFAAQRRSVVTDTAGNELVMPLSTFYIDINPQANWRAAHTIHKKELGDKLLEEFKQLGFQLVDSDYYLGIRNKQYRYVSSAYPGKSLYVTSTYEPWYRKGLYNTKVTWPCFVFEVYRDKQ